MRQPLRKSTQASIGTATASEVSLPTVISASNLTKRYGDLVAVDGIGFSVHRGECFGFLGPNGAGKTTTMKMVGCLSPVTDGELLVDGMSVGKDKRAIKSFLGVVSQSDSLDPDLNVIQNLMAYGRYFNLPRHTVKERALEVLDFFQLRAKARQRPDELSGGMRRRLLIARALLHQPRVLLLDEPTTGLDPQSRHLVWERLNLLKSQGITIILTSHYMDEAAYLCDRLVIMDHGRILVQGVPDELVHGHAGEQVVEIRAELGQKEGLLDSLRDRAIAYEDLGESVFVYGDNGALSPDAFQQDGYRVFRRAGNLEDVFLRLTGRGLREE